MGIIARQGIKRSLVSAIGVLIGIISIMFVYPLSEDSYGFAIFIYSTATILSLLLGLGSSGLVVKYYPEFKKNNISGFFGIVLSFALVNIFVISAIVILASLIYSESIVNLFNHFDLKIDLIKENLIPIYILAVIIILIRFIIYQSSNQKRIVIPSLINEFGYKIFLPAIVLIYYFGYIEMWMIPYLLIIFYLFSLFANSIYLKNLGGLTISNKSFLTLSSNKIKEMYKYMGFSGLNSLSANITVRIDTIMIPMLNTLSGTGIYGILMFMSNTIAIPNISLNQIASPIVSESIANNDFENIDNIYKKTSLNSYIIGAILFIIIWSILPHIIEIMPSDKDFMPYIYVFFFLGLAKLIDMLTSVNSYIIIYSKYYRFNLYFLLFLAVLNLILNYFFIINYGIVGAALATMISMFLYNLMKLIFIKLKFNLFPFDINTIKILIISFIVFAIGHYLPNLNFVLLNLVYKPIVLILLYYFAVKVFHLKADIIDLGESLILKVLKIVFK